MVLACGRAGHAQRIGCKGSQISAAPSSRELACGGSASQMQTQSALLQDSTHLLFLMQHVVDEEDAVSGAIQSRELFQRHAHIYPLVGFPVAPPLQGSGLHPHRLRKSRWGQSRDGTRHGGRGQISLG